MSEPSTPSDGLSTTPKPVHYFQVTYEGELVLAALHLPGWIAFNAVTLQELTRHVTAETLALRGKALTGEDLARLDAMVIDWLCTKYCHAVGLRQHLSLEGYCL
jgi:hypothetical protein